MLVQGTGRLPTGGPLCICCLSIHSGYIERQLARRHVHNMHVTNSGSENASTATSARYHDPRLMQKEERTSHRVPVGLTVQQSCQRMVPARIHYAVAEGAVERIGTIPQSGKGLRPMHPCKQSQGATTPSLLQHFRLIMAFHRTTCNFSFSRLPSRKTWLAYPAPPFSSYWYA
jgi:hypothetical protein